MATPDEVRPDLIPLIDLAPDEADLVRDAMANVGLEAVPHRVDPGAAEGELSKYVVRLYVPRAQLRDARAVVSGVLPGYASPAPRPDTLPAGEERAWDDIVAGLRADGVADPPMVVAPASPVEDVERFVPPEPPPLPRPSRAATGAWAAILGGLAALVVGMVFFGGGLVALAGVAAFIGGFVALVARAGGDRNHEDPDGGAVL